MNEEMFCDDAMFLQLTRSTKELLKTKQKTFTCFELAGEQLRIMTMIISFTNRRMHLPFRS